MAGNIAYCSKLGSKPERKQFPIHIKHAAGPPEHRPHAREGSSSQKCFVRSRAHSLHIASRVTIMHEASALPTSRATRTQTEITSRFGELFAMLRLVRTVNWHSWRRQSAGQRRHTNEHQTSHAPHHKTAHHYSGICPTHRMAAKTHRHSTKGHD